MLSGGEAVRSVEVGTARLLVEVEAGAAAVADARDLHFVDIRVRPH